MTDEDNPFMMQWLYFAIGLLIWMAIRQNAGTYYISKNKAEIIVLGLSYFTGLYFFWFYRYWMPHVVCNGFSGSFGLRPEPIGDYFVFGCGEVFDPVHIKGKIHTLVVPKRHMTKVGRNYVSVVRVKKTPLLNIPEDPARFLYHNKGNYNVDNIFYGEYSEEFMEANVNPLKLDEDLPKFMEERENFQRAINIRNRKIEGDNDLFEEVMETASRLGRRKTWKDFIPALKDKEEGEE